MGSLSEILIWSFMILQMLIIFMLARLVGGYITKVNKMEANLGVRLEKNKIKEGTVAPGFREFDQNNVAMTLPEEGAVLLFLNSSCSKCHSILTYINNIGSINKKVFVISNEKIDVEEEKQLSEIHYIVSSIVIKNYSITEFPSIIKIGRNKIVEEVQFQTNVEEVKRLLNGEQIKVS